MALVEGRSYALPDDVKRLAFPVFGHRLVIAGPERKREPMPHRAPGNPRRNSRSGLEAPMLRKLLAKLPSSLKRSHVEELPPVDRAAPLAMLTALYSSSAARRATWAGIAAALISLAIAAWVGIRFVPRLARGVDWAWMPFLTQYKITRDGGIFLGATSLVALPRPSTPPTTSYIWCCPRCWPCCCSRACCPP